MSAALPATRRALLPALLALLIAAAAAHADEAAPPPPVAPAEAPQAAPAPPLPAPGPAPEAKPEAKPAPEAKPPEAKPEAKAPAPPKNLESLPAGVATTVLGRKVRDASGADMGLVVDVLVDRSGIPLAAVIDFGGFLGVGSRKIAIDWQLLQFNPKDQAAPIELALTRAEVQAAPEFKPGASDVQIVGPPPAEGTTSPPDDGK